MLQVPTHHLRQLPSYYWLSRAKTHLLPPSLRGLNRALYSCVGRSEYLLPKRSLGGCARLTTGFLSSPGFLSFLAMWCCMVLRGDESAMNFRGI